MKKLLLLATEAKGKAYLFDSQGNFLKVEGDG